jgi:sorting and assembly machinery component 37
MALLEPLDSRVQGKSYCFSESRPASLDCLLFGYLSLMCIPNVPQPWLANMMQTKCPRLRDYVTNLQKELLGSPTKHGYALGRSAFSQGAETLPQEHGNPEDLPWEPSDIADTSSLGALVLESILGSNAFTKQLNSRDQIRTASYEARSQDIPPSPSLLSNMLTPTMAVASGVAVVLGTLFISQFSRRDEPLQNANLDDFGEAGAALSALADQMKYESAAASQTMENHTEPIMEVTVDGDGQLVVDQPAR